MSAYDVAFDQFTAPPLASRALLRSTAGQSALLLYFRLLELAENNTVECTNKELGDSIGFSDRSTTRGLKLLAALRLIGVARGQSKHRTLIVQLGVDRETHHALTAIAAGDIRLEADGLMIDPVSGLEVRFSTPPLERASSAKSGSIRDSTPPAERASFPTPPPEQVTLFVNSETPTAEGKPTYLRVLEVASSKKVEKSILRESSYNTSTSKSTSTSTLTTTQTDRSLAVVAELKHGSPCPTCGQRFDKRSKIAWEHDAEYRDRINQIWQTLKEHFPYAKHWKMNDRRWQAARRLLEHGFLVEQLCAAVVQATKSPYWTGKNRSGGLMLDFTTLFGKPETVDRLLAEAESGVRPTGPKSSDAFNPALGSSNKRGTAEEF